MQLHSWVALAGWVGAALLLLLSALTLSARWFWLGELAANLRFQLGCGGMLAAGLLLASRWRRSGALLALLALVHLWPAWSLWLPGPHGASGPSAASSSSAVGTALPLEAVEWQVASCNLYFNNREGAQWRAWVEQVQPDLLAVLEVSPYWHEQLEQLSELYPAQLVWPANEREWHGATFGLALLSRQPLSNVQICWGPWSGLPYLRARVQQAGAELDVFVAHPIRPGKGEMTEARNRMLAALGQAAHGPHTLLMGDLNCTLYSPAYADLLQATQLRDSRQGFGRLPTWTSDILIPGLELDLDHILVGDRLQVLARGRGPHFGSDHVPATATLLQWR